MLPLAEWIMRGRGQAYGFVLICLATSPIVWPNSIIGAAALSLVWLRKGPVEGMRLASWALLPCFVIAAVLQDLVPALLILSVCLASHILRSTRSLNLAINVIVCAGLLTCFGLEFLANEHLTNIANLIEEFFNQIRENAKSPEAQEILPLTVETSFIAGLFGISLTLFGFFSVALARSWQAKLYNPGGFQMEFHQYRLGKIETLVLVLFAILLSSLGQQYLTWVGVVLIPLLVAGTALFHAVSAKKRLSNHWYVIFYVVMILSDPVKVLLVMMAIADVSIDFRSKMNRPDQENLKLEVFAMDVILLEKIGKLGNLGDKVSVKAGYGRNYLIPFGKAVPATKDNLANFEARRAELEAAAADKLTAATGRAKLLEELTISIAANAGDEGKLFGSIGTRDIAEAITAAGTEVSKSEVRMPDGVIREVGEYEINIQLHSDVTTTVQVIVVAE